MKKAKISIIVIIVILTFSTFALSGCWLTFTPSPNLSQEVQQVENWLGVRMPSGTQHLYINQPRTGYSFVVLEFEQEPTRLLSRYDFKDSTYTGSQQGSDLEQFKTIFNNFVSSNDVLQDDLDWQCEFVWFGGSLPRQRLINVFETGSFWIVYFTEQQLLLFRVIQIKNL